jgi:uncharacterized protein VirK/YbjX
MLSLQASLFAVARGIKNLLLPTVQHARALRVLLFPEHANQLRALRFMEDFLWCAKQRDTYFFINHKHYLSRFFTPRQRIDSALRHYIHESRAFNPEYRAKVYGSDGIVLWEQRIADSNFRITLVATDDNRYEGDVSVLLWVNSVPVCRMSYSIVSSETFGLSIGAVPFITRNQIAQGRELEIFRECFPQNSPPYFCLAAIAGVATACDFNSIAAIKGVAQLAYESQYDIGFKNSYCIFWSQFGAREIGQSAYLIDVPPELPSLQDVKSKHRTRAKLRRTHWAGVFRSAQAAVKDYRLEPERSKLTEASADRTGLELRT